MIFFSFIFSLYVSYASQPKTIEGMFYFNKEIKIQSQKKTVEIDVVDDEGEAELKKLKSQGNECNVLSDNKFVCSKHIPNPLTAEEIEKQIIDYIPSYFIEFAEPEKHQIVSKDATLAVWSLDQLVRLNDVVVSNLKYYQLKENLKLSFSSDNSDQHWFNVIDSETLTMPYFFKIQKDEFSNLSFFVELVFKKIK